MSKEPKLNKPDPTIGPSFMIGNAAELKFKLWLPRDWLVRDRRPDFFLDFTVETSENGEPTANHFEAQVKGRTAKPLNGQLKEKFDTKHLAYYRTCRNPVFLFRIDPDTGAGHWLFIQRYLKRKDIAQKLTKQWTIKIAFDPNCNLDAKNLFKKEVDCALQFMSDQFPGSPVAALAKRKEFLESLDANVVIDLTATDKKVSTIINAKPGLQVSNPNILGNFSNQQWDALNSGQPVKLKGSDLTADTLLIQHLLAEIGDKEIIVERDIPSQRMSGSVQIMLEGISEFNLHLSGEWTIEPNRLSFQADLPETPLHLDSVWTSTDPAHLGNPDVTFTFKFSRWAGQQLSHLAYFDDLKRLSEGHPLLLRFLVRGQQLGLCKIISQDLLPGEFLADLIDWLGKLQKTAQYFGINPPFPSEEEKLSSFTTNDLRMMVEFATNGKCIRNFTDSTFTSTGPYAQITEPHPKKLGLMKIFNQYEKLDFLGILLNVGPLTFAWTDVILVAIKELPDGTKRLKWKGSPTGRFTMDLSDPPPSFLR